MITRLRGECIAGDQGKLFEQPKPFLMVGKSAIPYTKAATRLDLSEGAVRVAVHRLRRRYRDLLRDETAQTLSEPAQVDEGMQARFSAFAD